MGLTKITLRTIWLIMKSNEIRGVYKNIYLQAKMPFESNVSLNKADMYRWINVLKAAVKLYKASLKTLRDEVKIETSAFHLIKPFISVAILELQKKNKPVYTHLNDNCRLVLEKQLEESLINIVTNIVNDFNAGDDGALRLLDNIVLVYEQPLAFFRKYSVLSRLLSEAVINWVDNTSTVFNRLIKDYAELSELYNIQAAPENNEAITGFVDAVEVGLSDPHEHSQSVWIITFLDGNKIVYKPKNMDAEVYFNKFVDWINASGSYEKGLSTLGVISKETYGWVQYVDSSKECLNESDVCTFYKHLGNLSAILYVLRGTDYHHENLIAAADMPYFIDHEMLCYPVYKGFNPEIDDACDDVQDNVYESVLNTRIFSVEENRLKGQAKDISAVGYYAEGKANIHLPKLNSKYQRYKNHADSIIEGFKETYINICKHKDILLNSVDSPLNSFKNLHIRFNVRATSTYSSIIRSCVVPAALTTGQAFCDYIHALRVRYPSIFSQGLPLDMRLEELKILTRLDVPRFTIEADSTAIDDFAGGSFGAIFDESGYQLVLRRIEKLGSDDMNVQVAYIAKSLAEDVS